MMTPIDSALMTTLGEMDARAEARLIAREPVRIAAGEPVLHETLGRGVFRLIEDRFVTIEFAGPAGRRRFLTSLVLPQLKGVER